MKEFRFLKYIPNGVDNTDIIEIDGVGYDADIINSCLVGGLDNSTEEEIMSILQNYEEYEILPLYDNKAELEHPLDESEKYDWKHIDPLTGLPKIKKETIEDKIHMMNQMPAMSGWIVMLQNRVNYNSVGNQRYKKELWYNRVNHTVSIDENGTDATPFKSYTLPHCGKPGGWIYKKDIHR